MARVLGGAGRGFICRSGTRVGTKTGAASNCFLKQDSSRIHGYSKTMLPPLTLLCPIQDGEQGYQQCKNGCDEEVRGCHGPQGEAADQAPQDGNGG